MWSVVTEVTTAVTLAAFIAALAAWAYRTSLVRQERLIRSASEIQRAPLVESALEVFRLDTTGLTKEQKYQLALRQIHARERRFRTVARVVVLLGVLLAGVSAYAIARTAPASGAPTPDDAREPSPP